MLIKVFEKWINPNLITDLNLLYGEKEAEGCPYMEVDATKIAGTFINFNWGSNERGSYQLFIKSKTPDEVAKTELLIPLLVILELIWVLDSAYDIDRGDILESINDLLLMPILKFEQRTVLQKFILSAQQNNYDLSDLLIAHSAKFQGSDKTITFDKKAAKHELFELFQ